MRLDEKRLNEYFEKLRDSLKTGKDRVNPEKFESISTAEYKTILRKIEKDSYEFSGFKSIERNNRIVYIPTIRDRLVLEYLKDSIKQRFKVRIPSRENIVESISRQLNENIDYYVVRMDIKNFFTSIPSNELLSKIDRSTLMRAKEFLLLKQFLMKQQCGLVPGIPVSNYLSEIYLEKFDIRLKRIHPRVLYSFRYVDDILLLISGKVSMSEREKIEDDLYGLFEDFGLKSNERKKSVVEFNQNNDSEQFDYLGYTFKRKAKGKNTSLEVEISDKKISKVFSRVNRIFSSFYVNHDFDLLHIRLLALMSDQKITKNIKYERAGIASFYSKNIAFGVCHDYQLAGERSFEKIDSFVRHKLSCINIEFPDRVTRNRLFSLSIIDRMKRGKAIIYKNIPFGTLRSYVNKYSDLSYAEVRKLEKQQLIIEYYKILNI